MNSLLVCALVAVALTASASALDVAKFFGDKFNFHIERFPSSPASTEPVVSTVTKGKFYKSSAAGAVGATNYQYAQLVMFMQKDCTGDVLFGDAYLMNYCFLYGYENAMMKTTPYFMHFTVNNQMMMMNIFNNSNCNGNATFSDNNFASVGCNVMGSDSMRAVVTPTPLWPQGQGGMSVKTHHTSSACNADDGFAYNFNTDNYYKLNTCLNVSTAQGMGSAMVTACSSAANNYKGMYTIMSFAAPSCAGASTSQNVWSTDLCGTAAAAGYGVAPYGFDSLTCLDQPIHNKCYENFGISAPGCTSQLTQHALKFTCMDPGYTGCESRILSNPHKKNTELFACCV